MEITLSLVNNIPVLHLSGRLDVATSPLLEERLQPLLAVTGQRIIFSCTDLNYVSSAGLRVFISTLRCLRANGGSIAFASLTKPVRELFRLAGLENLFLIEPTIETAAAHFG
jgi:anti-anti-sigma factor